MKRLVKTILVSGLFIFAFASPVLSLLSPATPTVSAANCEGRFLGIPPWYRGLTQGDDCAIKGPDANDPNGISKFIWKIVLNGIEMALVVAVYIASFFVLYGGFLFMTGGGNSSTVQKARETIFNAVIGLVIALGSIGIVNLLFSGIFGTSDATSSNGINGLVNLSGEQLLANALNLAYFVAGVVAVIVIIIAGIMYTTSTGDSGRVSRAKNMLVYAIAGLVVVLVAFTITGFVTGRFTS